MKRITVLSVALGLGIALLALISSDSRTKAAPVRTYYSEPKAGPRAKPLPPRTYIADTGMITLGPNEFLRMTVVAARSRQPTSLTVTFTGQVTESVCNGGVCTHTVTSEYTTAPVTLMQGQAASHDIVPTPGASAVRAVVTGNSPDMLVNGLIIDGTTGQGREVVYYTITLTNAS